MDTIEKLITENRAFFNNEKMPEGHKKRFEDRLRKNKRPVLRTLSPWLAAAAVVAVVLMLPIMRTPSATNDEGVLGRVNAEYNEVDFYFTSSIEHSVSELNALIESGVGSEQDKIMVQEEMAELEQRHQQLMEDLQLAPDDEVILNAMIEVYQKKLELMNAILEKLYDVKKQKEGFEAEEQKQPEEMPVTL